MWMMWDAVQVRLYFFRKYQVSSLEVNLVKLRDSWISAFFIRYQVLKFSSFKVDIILANILFCSCQITLRHIPLLHRSQHQCLPNTIIHVLIVLTNVTIVLTTILLVVLITIALFHHGILNIWLRMYTCVWTFFVCLLFCSVLVCTIEEGRRR